MAKPTEIGIHLANMEARFQTGHRATAYFSGWCYIDLQTGSIRLLTSDRWLRKLPDMDLGDVPAATRVRIIHELEDRQSPCFTTSKAVLAALKLSRERYLATSPI